MIEVGSDDAGQRLDRWFRRLFPHVGQGRIEKMCRKGEIRLDGGRVKASSRVQAGQIVRVPPLPSEGVEAPRQFKPSVSDADARMIQSAVLYRDDHIIALNKPPGLPTQGGSKQKRHVDGLAEALRFGFGRETKAGTSSGQGYFGCFAAGPLSANGKRSDRSISIARDA